MAAGAPSPATAVQPPTPRDAEKLADLEDPEDPHEEEFLSAQETDASLAAVSPVESVRTFTAAMAAAARRDKGIDASCAIPALLGVVAANPDEQTTLQATRAINILLRDSFVNRSAAHDGGGVALMVSLLPLKRADDQSLSSAAA